MPQAKGRFDVKRTAEPPYDTVDGVALARARVDKQFHGDLDATAVVDMISAGGGAPGSAGYVAMERVTGALAGRSGTFVLQHTATMDRGTPSLAISVVPDSGTGELRGVRGTMTIEIAAGGEHSYVFEYVLA